MDAGPTLVASVDRGAGMDRPGPARAPLPGFLLDRGRYTSFEADDPNVQVFPTGINNRGVIVGEFVRPDVRESGLLRTRNGKITTFDIPGADTTIAADINDRGQVIGIYENPNAAVPAP